MAERSLLWTTGATGDGVSPYTQTDLFNWLRRTFLGDNYASEGVLVGYNNGLAVSAGAGQVTVATGAAVVYGIPYENDAAVNVTIPTPVSNTRIDRIVLRASWSAQTVRITRIAGTEGAGEPALTQTANTTWDIPLAKVSITTGGAITVTDERSFAHFASAVRTENLDAGITIVSPILSTSPQVPNGGKLYILGASPTGVIIFLDSDDSLTIRDHTFTKNLLKIDEATGSVVTLGQGTLWGASNDGAGSGLDADLIGGRRIQTGSATPTTVSGTGMSTVNVTFPVAFSAAPVVVATSENGAVIVSVTSVTAVGCTIQLQPYTSMLSVTVHPVWIAIGAA